MAEIRDKVKQILDRHARRVAPSPAGYSWRAAAKLGGGWTQLGLGAFAMLGHRDRATAGKGVGCPFNPL
jgi:hypothetical protein